MFINVSFAIPHEELPRLQAFLVDVEAHPAVPQWAKPPVDTGNGQENAEDAAIAFAVKQATETAKVLVAETVVFGEEDVASATLALANKKGVGAASAVLAQFSVTRARDLKPEQRAEYIAAAKVAEAAE